MKRSLQLPSPGRLYMVAWLDTCAEAGWDGEDVTPKLIISIGWLVKRDRYKITIAMDTSVQEDGVYGGCCAIPIGCVKLIKRIQYPWRRKV